MVSPINVIVPDEVKKLAADSLLPVFSPLHSRTVSESDNVSDFLDLKKSLKRAGLLAKYAPLDGSTKLLEIGFDPTTCTPQEFAKIISDDYEKWGKVIAAAGIKPE